MGVRARAKGTEPEEIRTRVVADASGSATLIGTQLGLKDRVPGLNKVSIWSYYREASAARASTPVKRRSA